MAFLERKGQLYFSPFHAGHPGGGAGGTHVVVVVRGGSGAQNLVVALQEGLKAALQPLELLEHFDVLRRGRMAVGDPETQ